jgi:hypothetical protein
VTVFEVAAERTVRRRASILAALGMLMTATAADAQAPGGPKTRSAVARPSADSARADSAAFDALPPALREVLDVRARVTPTSADPNVVCVVLSTTSDGSTRQRLQGRLADGTSLVVFARSSKRGALRRVEFVRKLASGEQRGFTWDAEGDATTGMEWPAGSTVSTSYKVPRGSPVPRAIRALGRLVAAWSCH